MLNGLYANPIIPDSGLGNKLLPWARAAVFCKRTGAKMLAPVWMRLPRLGPWIFGERDKRLYYRTFANEDCIDGLKRWWILHRLPHISESEYEEGTCGSVVVDFKGHEQSFFTPLIGEEQFIRDSIYRMTNDRIHKSLRTEGDDPFVALHVRRGDFGRAGFKVDDQWYVKALSLLLTLPESMDRKFVRIFSDAHASELDFLKRAFPAERFVFDPTRPAIHDILLMAKAKALVCTSHSTFSMWARFLGGMPTIWDAPRGRTPDYIGGDMGSACYFV